MQVNEIYEIDDQIGKQNQTAQTRLDELSARAKELKKTIELIECPRDDSLDNSVIIWQSQSFASLGGNGSSDSPGSGTTGESSVNSICNKLEDSGMQIKRCSDFDEVVSRVRDLHADKRLRCVVRSDLKNKI